MRRTFIATPIEPGAKLSQTHTKLRNALKNEKIKWVDGDHFHITLFFLGDTSERAITQVRQKLGDLLPGFSAFQMRLKGLGVFKNMRKPRVLWAGIEQYEPLKAIKQAIDRELEPMGFTPDKREFKPHLTLARMKWVEDKEKLEGLVHTHQQEEWQWVRIREIIYYQSRLTQSGPVYTPIERFRLDESAE